MIELLIVVAIIGILAAISVPVMRRALLLARVKVVAADCKQVYAGFIQFYQDQNMYPNASSAPKFNLKTFEPLRSMQYYDGAIAGKLKGGKADGYNSPDDQGNNREFWLEMTLENDNSVRFLVAESNNAPMGGGKYRSGVYIRYKGKLMSADQFKP